VAGEILDGEGGFTVWGRLMPAAASLRQDALPIGLAHHVKLRRPVVAGAVLRWNDVIAEESSAAVKIRRAMAAMFAGEMGPAQRSAAE
jgi:predicted homoserine dehydrogenase-like protein